MKYRFITACLVAVALAAVVACGKSAPTAPTDTAGATITTGSGSTGQGRLSVTLKDSPFSDAKAFLVTFSEVSVHASGGGWVTVPFANGATARTCDLKQLQTATDLLGVATLDAGHYTEIRLTVASAKLYFDNPAPAPACTATLPVIAGASESVTIPSGVIKLNRPFDIAAGNTLQVLLDFDGDKSVHMTGNGKYQMSPVISVVSVQ